MGTAGRGTVTVGSASSAKTGFSLEPLDITRVRAALRTKGADEAAGIISGYLLKGTGVDLLIGLLNAAIYVYDKYQEYQENVRLHGEEEANIRLAVEVGKDVTKTVVNQVLVEQAVAKLKAEKVIPEELSGRVEEIVDDIVELGIEKIEEQFLEE